MTTRFTPTDAHIRAYVFGDPARPDLKSVHVIGDFTEAQERTVRENVVEYIKALPAERQVSLLAGRLNMAFADRPNFNYRMGSAKEAGNYTANGKYAHGIHMDGPGFVMVVDPAKGTIDTGVADHEHGHHLDNMMWPDDGGKAEYYSATSGWLKKVAETIKQEDKGIVEEYLVKRAEGYIDSQELPSARDRLKREVRDYVKAISEGRPVPRSGRAKHYFIQGATEVYAEMDSWHTTLQRNLKTSPLTVANVENIMRNKWGEAVWEHYKDARVLLGYANEKVIEAQEVTITARMEELKKEAETSGATYDEAAARETALLEFYKGTIKPEPLDGTRLEHEYGLAYREYIDRNGFYDSREVRQRARDEAATQFATLKGDREAIIKAIYDLRKGSVTDAGHAQQEYATMRAYGFEEAKIKEVMEDKYPYLTAVAYEEIKADAEKKLVPSEQTKVEALVQRRLTLEQALWEISGQSAALSEDKVAEYRADIIAKLQEAHSGNGSLGDISRSLSRKGDEIIKVQKLLADGVSRADVLTALGTPKNIWEMKDSPSTVMFSSSFMIMPISQTPAHDMVGKLTVANGLSEEQIRKIEQALGVTSPDGVLDVSELDSFKGNAITTIDRNDLARTLMGSDPALAKKFEAKLGWLMKAPKEGAEPREISGENYAELLKEAGIDAKNIDAKYDSENIFANEYTQVLQRVAEQAPDQSVSK